MTKVTIYQPSNIVDNSRLKWLTHKSSLILSTACQHKRRIFRTRINHSPYPRSNRVPATMRDTRGYRLSLPSPPPSAALFAHDIKAAPARQWRSGSLKSRLLDETNAVRGAPRRRRLRARGLWMRSTSDNARNVEAFMPSPLRPAAPFSRHRTARARRVSRSRAHLAHRSWQQHLER